LLYDYPGWYKASEQGNDKENNKSIKRSEWLSDENAVTKREVDGIAIKITYQDAVCDQRTEQGSC
jgi:hypothetical protein